MIGPKARLRLEKISLFVLMSTPLIWTSYLFFTHGLGANPVEAATHRTGLWALRLLLITLLITPLRIIFSWRRPIVFRRMIGLFAFVYALTHFGIYLFFDQELDFSETATDIAKRPYITIGFAAFLLLLPLVVTSNTFMLKKIGAKRWRQVHKLIYPITLLVVIHFVWVVKADFSGPGIYAATLAVLLGVRIFNSVRHRTRARSHEYR